MSKQKPKIVVSEKLKLKLDSLGSKGDTYEKIIWELIKIAKKIRRKVRG